ncbi:M28 family peptidase [Roseivirga misakiensis]|uniref:Peptidase M20 n=1 Tax=Roseivirga misakiensis TaxID=1563681 RepID=A0A1E5T752_9BACT|nr:M28 family peptidase [Roseivirga misakiensis]OEK07127.1 peptidase M20 [Roseivirga misakiensis]
MQRYSNFIVLFIFSLCVTLSATAQLNRLDTELMLDDLRRLSHDAAQGRKTGTPGAEAARRFIIGQFKDVSAKSYKKGYRHPFTFKNRNGEEIEGVNVIGVIKGKESSAFAITAHYDHLGVRDSLIYNGADDNASGVAALLGLMEYFRANKPRHTLIFAALDGEEMGLRGATAFLEDQKIPVEDVVLNINMDMISINDKNELYVAGTHHYPNLKPIVEKIDPAPLQLKLGHDTPDLGYNDWTNQSDHGAFHKKGIPFLYFGVEDHAHYHKPTDTFENVNQEFYIKATHAILDCILALDINLN